MYRWVPVPNFRYRYRFKSERYPTLDAWHVNAHITANKAERLFLKLISATLLEDVLRGIRHNLPKKKTC